MPTSPGRLVVRAEDFYTPPPHLRADAWAAVPPAELVISWYQERHGRRLPPPSGGEWPDLWARIDAGRWVAQCPCGSAQVVTPNDPRMACVECGAGWFTVTFPADVEAAEQAVAALLPHTRYWWQPGDPANPTPTADEHDGQDAGAGAGIEV